MLAIKQQLLFVLTTPKHIKRGVTLSVKNDLLPTETDVPQWKYRYVIQFRRKEATNMLHRIYYKSKTLELYSGKALGKSFFFHVFLPCYVA